MNLKLYIFFLFLLIKPFNSLGQKLVFTESLQDAYQDIFSLKIASGEGKIILSKLKDPQNSMVYYVENYVDFLTLFTQEDENKYKLLLKNKEYRLEQIKKADSKSPYYLFCQAEIILQWAIIKLKFGDRINGAKDVYEAYRLLEANQKKFPDFTENLKSLSLIHAMAESLPSWFRKIMGIKGSIQLGTSEIKNLANYAQKSNHIFLN